MPISHTRGILGRAVVGCPSNVHPQLWRLSAPLQNLCLLKFVPYLSVEKLEFYRIISRLMAISLTRGNIGRAVDLLSVECTPSTLVSISSSLSPLSGKLCSMSVHRSVQKLQFYRRHMPISHTRGIVRMGRRSFPLNAHPQLWCLSAPLHHHCLPNFVP